MAGMIDLVVIVMALVSAATSLLCLRAIRDVVARIPAQSPALTPVVDVQPVVVQEDPVALPSANDELLADLEELERSSRGASTSSVCTHWDEQDERDAFAEDVALSESRAVIRRLPVRYH